MSDLHTFCYNLPKVELHAHLNTSYSKTTLLELLRRKNVTEEIDDLKISSNNPIAESFKLFTKIQSLVTTEEDVYFLTKKVIEEYAEDNVMYLELRSTPKNIPDSGMTKELYLRTMLKAVNDCKDQGLPIIVRLLVSIDRRHGVEPANVSVNLAEKLMKEDSTFVGIDLSGDPAVGDVTDYIPVFLNAAAKNLKLALHLAELDLDHSYQETEAVLKHCCDIPMRIGHGTFLHHDPPSEKWSKLADLVLENKIPIETCITSNLRTKTVESLEKHHFKYWNDKKHPVVICADGKGAYDTSLTQEYFLAMRAFQITKQEIRDYVLRTIDCIFEGPSVKEKLRLLLQQFEITNNI